MNLKPGSVVLDKESNKTYLVISALDKVVHATEIPSKEDTDEINSTSIAAVFTGRKIVLLSVAGLQSIDDLSDSK